MLKMNKKEPVNYKKLREKFIGQRFGKLVILEEIGVNKWKKPIVKCICDCGQYFECVLGNIRFRNIHQCNSCRYIFHKTAEKSKAGFNILKIRYKNNAKSRNLDFDLSDEQFKKLTTSNCFYCNQVPSMHTRNSNVKYKNEGIAEFGNYIYNGIDRIDSDLGYTIENCVPCCGICNIAKSNYKQDEFLEWIKRVYKHTFKDEK